MSVSDTASDLSEGIENTDELAMTIGHAGAFDDNTADSLQQLQQKRAKIEGEHEGLRGFSNWLYAKAGLEPSYEQELQRLEEAERASEQADQQIAWRQNIAQSRHWSADLHMQAQMSNMPANRIQDIPINQQYQQELVESGRIVGDPKREAQAQADALEIKTAQEHRLYDQSGLEYANLQSGIRAAQLTLAGDPQAAQREQFDQDQVDQRVALVEQYGEQSGQVKSFDQKSALERQELLGKQAQARQQTQSESARAMADVQGEVHESQLRAAGNTYEADRDQFIRTGEDKVKILREQANAANDTAVKTQLLAQAEAQEKANAQELTATDAVRKGQQDSAAPADSESKKKEQAEQDKIGQQAVHSEQLASLQANAHASGMAAVGKYEALRESLIEHQEEDAKDTGKFAADRTSAAARIRQFAAQARNAGAGQILSAQQYADAVGASILHGSGAGQALGMAAADLKTLGGGAGLGGDLGEVGQKLSSAADKWNHIADQMRNVTILTMGR
jgi:hypothetical protein